MGEGTGRALVVTEAMHDGGAEVVAELLKALEEELAAHWNVVTRSAVLTADAPEFVLEG